MKNINWKKRAEDALGITRRMQNREHWDHGTYHDLSRLRLQVPDIAAALAQAYGEGYATGAMEKESK